MELQTFEETVARAVGLREVLTAFVECDITYSGRAEAFLDRGERLFIIKADGAVLIHQPEGSSPINYMRPGSTLSFVRETSHLFLKVENSADKSTLEVNIYAVNECHSRKLEDGRKQDLAGNERDMSDWIRDHPESIAKDFQPISREEQTDVGFIDVLGHDKKGSIVVVECKRITASLTAVDQLRRYVERVKEIKGVKKVKGVLAAPAITPNALEMLTSWGFVFAKVDPPKRLERWQKNQKRLGEF